MKRRAHIDELIVSGFLSSDEEVERTIEELLAAAVPRDLVEVVVSAEGSKKHFGGRARSMGTLALPDAAKGALVGLGIGIVLSLEIFLLPGFELPRHLSIIHLLGPNVGAIGGALVGALAGALSRRKARGVWARVRGRDDVLVVVRGRSREEAPIVARLLRAHGAADVRIDEPRAPESVREPSPQA